MSHNATPVTLLSLFQKQRAERGRQGGGGAPSSRASRSPMKAGFHPPPPRARPTADHPGVQRVCAWLSRRVSLPHARTEGTRGGWEPRPRLWRRLCDGGPGAAGPDISLCKSQVQFALHRRYFNDLDSTSRSRLVSECRVTGTPPASFPVATVMEPESAEAAIQLRHSITCTALEDGSGRISSV